MRDGMLIQKYLLLIFAKLFRYFIEIDDAVVDGFFVCVVLTYPQPFRDRLQALLKIVHFQVDESS
jgi:hypothetical protein